MMTYQSTAEQFAARIPARGQSISTAPFLGARVGLKQLAAMFRAIGNALIKASEGSSRIARIEALQAKTDAELAQMGLRRDQIMHYVFRDLYYC